MNLIDLREFTFKIDKIISLDESGFIFNTEEDEESVNKRYLYKYHMKNKHISKINTKGIEMSESNYCNHYILNDYIYTNSSRRVKESEIENSMCRVSLMNNKVEPIYSIKKNVTFILISERYLLLSGSNDEIDEKNYDVQKDIQGEYDYAILCDLKDKKEYEIKDKRVILGIRDHFISYTVDGLRYIVFEEAYMDDWELEEMFKDGMKKEDFYRNGYRESINIITLDAFVKAVQESCETIPFNQIHKTELTSCTRYFGMDDENIYYRVNDFESKVQFIYSMNKRTLEKQLLKSIQMGNREFSFLNYSIWYDIENRKIYETKIIDGKTKEVKEILHEDFTFKYEGINEDFIGLVGNWFVTSYWIEDDLGDNLVDEYKDFVKIRNIISGDVQIYEGVCTIIKDNIIVFI